MVELLEEGNERNKPSQLDNGSRALVSEDVSEDVSRSSEVNNR